jgi:hypothetical protein
MGCWLQSSTIDQTIISIEDRLAFGPLRGFE